MRNAAKCLGLLLFLAATETHLAFTQAWRAPRSSAASLDLDSLLHSPGPSWTISRSQHFVVYVERGAHSAERNAHITDNLESAWTNAGQLLGMRIPDTPLVPVLVTASRTRFPSLMRPDNKGLTTMDGAGHVIIILIHNDSVKAYARHEVMHMAAFRTWGPPRSAAQWLSEGLATYADGKCQGTTIAAVARDLLGQSPAMTLDDATARFPERAVMDRGRAYVLAGSIVGYLWATRGRDGVRALWQGRDSLNTSVSLAPSLGTGLFATSTVSWRAYVARVAGAQPGIDAAAFQRVGCG